MKFDALNSKMIILVGAIMVAARLLFPVMHINLYYDEKNVVEACVQYFYPITKDCLNVSQASVDAKTIWEGSFVPDGQRTLFQVLALTVLFYALRKLVANRKESIIEK